MRTMTFERTMEIINSIPVWDNEDIFCESEEEKEATFDQRLDSLIKRLEMTGLWPDTLERLYDFRQMSVEDRREIYMACATVGDSVELYRKTVDMLKAKYGSKYPFLFFIDKEGNEWVHPWYIGEGLEYIAKAHVFQMV